MPFTIPFVIVVVELNLDDGLIDKGVWEKVSKWMVMGGEKEGCG